MTADRRWKLPQYQSRKMSPTRCLPKISTQLANCYNHRSRAKHPAPPREGGGQDAV